MKAEKVFIDTGAWIGLVLENDRHHPLAREIWETLERTRSPLFTSIPVVLETFTFLERNAALDVALRWRDGLSESRVKSLECSAKDLRAAWLYFSRKDLYKLSATDATSFAIMQRERIRVAFTFDHHFSSVGFRNVG